MADLIYIQGVEMVLGDRLVVGPRNIRYKTGAVISGATATARVFDSSGTILLSSGEMTITLGSSQTRLSATYTLRSGDSILTTDGRYLGVYKVTFPDGTIKQYLQHIIVLPNQIGSVVVDNPPPRGAWVPYRQMQPAITEQPYRQRRTMLAQ